MAAGVRPRNSANSVPTFLLVWVGQVVSLVGTGLTGFALGVWMYQQTGSVTQLSLIAVCNRLPSIAVAPLAGALVDRTDRRRVLMLCQVAAGASTLSMALAVLSGGLPLWHVCLALTINSTAAAFQWLASGAATTLLVPKKFFGRASGLNAVGDALGLLFSPLLGAALVLVIRIEGIFLIDFVTYVFAFATLLPVSIPRPVEADGAAAKGSLRSEAGLGWRYVYARPGLFGLLLFFALTNFLGGFLAVLTTPLILSFATGKALGMVLTVGGGGLLAGSLLMSVWGGPRRRVRGIFVSQVAGGLCLMLAGASPSAGLVAAAAFGFYFTRPLVNGCSEAVWQSKVPPELQGRVFAVRRVLAWSSLPLAYVLAGPLADYVFEPVLGEGGLLASSVGPFLGNGRGRGIGLLFILLGLLTMLTVVAGQLYSRLRLLEDELKDCVPDAALPEFAGR